MTNSFLKWAGNKEQIKDRILQHFPDLESINLYCEPFLGSGSVFLEFVQNRIETRCDCVLNDLNRCIMQIFSDVIDGKFTETIHCYEVLVYDYNYSLNKDAFYKDFRAEFNQLKVLEHELVRLTPYQLALFLFLNRTCYNGLWRENKKGEFNAPCNHIKCIDPEIVCNKLRGISTLFKYKCLDEKVLMCTDYKTVFTHPVFKKHHPEQVFIYLDPPYYPTSTTSNFTQFSAGGFNETEQENLCTLLTELDKKDYKWLLSNSDVPRIRELYAKWHIEEIQVPRKINCKGDKRGCVTELLIQNY